MPRYHVSRSIMIDADPQRVYDTVADFGTWTTWSPWLCCEPDAEVTVTHNPNSVGSVYKWSGKVVGAGEIEHRELQPGSLIDQQIRFLRPFKSVSRVYFEVKPAGDQSKITWHMQGSLPFFLFWMKSSLETFIGMDYERGLKMLKELIETGRVQATTKIQGIETVGPMRVMGVRAQSRMNECGELMKDAFHKSAEDLQAAGVNLDREVLTVYHATDLKKRTFDFTAGFVVPEDAPPVAGLSDVRVPSTSAFCVQHEGSYDHLGNAWTAAYKNIEGRKLKANKKIPALEIYRNNPEETPEAELQTDIIVPIR